jgi:hypothetical protein
MSNLPHNVYRPAILGLLALVIALTASPALAQTENTEQLIVVLRHGEKPPAGLGQLTCKGLQRALRLPAWLSSEFPTPDAIFAPDPSVQATEIHGDGQRYDYIRPLVTIAPTAIALGMPVNTQLPFNDSGLLADTLLAPEHRDKVIYVAWEHLQIMNFAQVVLRRLGSDAEVPEWTNDNYDTVFAFHITWGSPPAVRFEVKQQTYGSLPENCPTGG